MVKNVDKSNPVGEESWTGSSFFDLECQHLVEWTVKYPWPMRDRIYLFDRQAIKVKSQGPNRFFTIMFMQINLNIVKVQEYSASFLSILEDVSIVNL